MNALLAIFALESACDGYTAFNVIRFKGREVWWPMKWAMKYLGVYWALMVAKVGMVAAVWYAISIGQMPLWILGPMEVGYGVLILSNWLQLQKHKGQ